MRVRVYGPLRDIVGSPEVTVPAAAGATVGEVLQQLVERYPLLRRRLFALDGSLQPYLLIALGGRDIRHCDGLQAVVKPGEDVLIYPPGAGG